MGHSRFRTRSSVLATKRPSNALMKRALHFVLLWVEQCEENVLVLGWDELPQHWRPQDQQCDSLCSG